MALVSGRRSTLNPNAPLFVPAAFRQIEDFSPEWWQLVTTSTWFHEYWLSQRQDDGELFGNTETENDVVDFLPETFDLDVLDDVNNLEDQFEEFIQFAESEGWLNDWSVHSVEGRGLELNEVPANYAEKPADGVSPQNKSDRR